MSELEGAFIQVILESWRFAKGYSKLVEKLDLLERQKYRGRYDWYLRKLREQAERAGFVLKEYDEGTVYDPGMAVKALNADECPEGTSLVEEQMVEPIILRTDGQLVKLGTILVRGKA